MQVSAVGLAFHADGDPARFPSGTGIGALHVRVGSCRIRGDALLRNTRSLAPGRVEVGCLFFPIAAEEDRWMTLIAGIAAVRRTSRRFPGVWLSSTLSILVSSWVVAGIALTAIVRVEPWYLPQYAIPLLGMILGNALTGISLGLDRFTEALVRGRDEVELYLTLGGTRWDAALPAIREAVRTGMIPILNSMTVVGLVSLPGMMTGQLLAGVPPSEAVKYQIVIMFLIASVTGLGTVGAVLLSYTRLFNHRHQFLFEAIGKVN